MAVGGGIKAAFLEELETQQWEQAGLVGIGGKVGSFVSKDLGQAQCPTPHPPSCLHPVLPWPQDSHILHQIMLHRRVATQYDLETDELFESFLQAVELLDEEQR